LHLQWVRYWVVSIALSRPLAASTSRPPMVRCRGLWWYRRRDRIWCVVAASGGLDFDTTYGALSRPLAASTSASIPPRTVLEILSTLLQSISTVLPRYLVPQSCRNRAAIVSPPCGDFGLESVHAFTASTRRLCFHSLTACQMDQIDDTVVKRDVGQPCHIL